MSQVQRKYGFFAEEGSPVHQILESLKAKSSQSFKAAIEDALLLMEYPFLLQKQGASPQQVIGQAEESIRRFHQKITAMNALINSLPPEGGLNPKSAIASNGKSSQSESAIASNGQSSYFEDSFEEEEDEETSYHVLKAEDIF